MEKDRIKNREGQGHCQLRRDEVLLKRKQLHIENTVGKVIHLDIGKYNAGETERDSLKGRKLYGLSVS